MGRTSGTQHARLRIRWLLHALALTALVAVLALIALGTSSGIAAAQSCTDRSRDTALLTIKILRMWSQPIRWRSCDLARGPIWDPEYHERPGQGKSMVIDAHDVTPVPGYGAHGPFYRLHLIKPGDLATIRWQGVTRTYRFVTKPFAEWQCRSKSASIDPRRYTHKLICFPNNTPIKDWSVEGFYIRCCWPRYTDYKFLYERAVLIKTQPSS
jgi:hypothetical protein